MREMTKVEKELFIMGTLQTGCFGQTTQETPSENMCAILKTSKERAYAETHFWQYMMCQTKNCRIL